MKNLLFAVLFLSVPFFVMAETEPNDYAWQANTLTLGVLDNGTFTTGLPVENDWFKFTVTADDSIVITVISTNISPWFSLYGPDTIATPPSEEIETGDTVCYSYGLSPGTYYINVGRYYMGTGSYTIIVTSHPATLTNDAEPNKYAKDAITLPVNGSLTGHIGYWKEGAQDSTDWHKVTIPSDGKLSVTVKAKPFICFQVELFDQDTITSLKSTSGTLCDDSIKVITYNNLAAGTYYIKNYMNFWSIVYDHDFGSYTLSNEFTPAGLTNDAEPNNTLVTALTLPVNGNSTGHIGYYGNKITDTDDWYKITLPSDGKFVLSTVTDTTLCLAAYLYDQDSTTQIASTNTFPCDSFNKSIIYNNLAAGTYFIKCIIWNASYYGAYTISDVFTPADLTNDVEPNNTAKTPVNIPVNDTLTGHIGFYGNDFTDTDDWYKVTLPADGRLVVNTSTDTTLCMVAYLYDQDSVTQLVSTSSFICDTVNKTMIYNNLAAGTYFIKCILWNASYYGAYTISDIFTPANLTNDAEPDNFALYAVNLPVDDSRTGHIGYYGNNITDVTDWYKITTSATGDLVVNTISDTTVCLIAYLYDQDSLTELASTYSFDCDTFNKSMTKTNLTAGTYYVKCVRYLIHPTTYGAYTISNQFTIATEIAKINTPENKFAVYPNPANNLLSVEKGNKEISLIEIYDMLGSVVYRSNYINKIDVSRFPSGLYLINITDAYSNQTKLKVIVEH
ncbi:MAG: T9SS type A sorting domain-containing protein [Bacteroidales bacterium]|nr:T9SS type A sorting domain-containing protein [Bacteroidales bacterium]